MGLTSPINRQIDQLPSSILCYLDDQNMLNILAAGVPDINQESLLKDFDDTVSEIKSLAAKKNLSTSYKMVEMGSWRGVGEVINYAQEIDPYEA